MNPINDLKSGLNLFNRFRHVGLCILLLLSASYATAESPGANKPEIVFATSEWIPMSFQNCRNEPEGLYVDFLQKVFRNLNAKPTVRFRPWKRAQAEVEKGVSDFLITVPTQKRLEYSVQSKEPFHLMYLHIYTYKDHPKRDLIEKIRTIDDILKLNLTAVSNLGNEWHINEIESKGVKTIYVGSETPALNFLAMKRADIMIDAIIPTNYLIRSNDLTSKIERTNARFGPLKVYILMSKKSSFINMMPEIEKAYAEVKKSGEFDKLIKGYSLLE